MALDEKFVEACEIACEDIRAKAHSAKWYKRKDYDSLKGLYDQVLEELVDTGIKIVLENPGLDPLKSDAYDYLKLEEKYPEATALANVDNLFFHAVMDLGSKDKVEWYLQKIEKLDYLHTKKLEGCERQGSDEMRKAIRKAHGLWLVTQVQFDFGVKNEHRIEEALQESLTEARLSYIKKKRAINSLKGYYKKGLELLK